MRVSWHGIDVTEGGPDLTDVGIVDVVIHVETRWCCPGCKTSWSKSGDHAGKLKRCRKCGSKFFLRRWRETDLGR